MLGFTGGYIYLRIYCKNQRNVGEYTIHGSYRIVLYIPTVQTFSQASSLYYFFLGGGAGSVDGFGVFKINSECLKVHV